MWLIRRVLSLNWLYAILSQVYPPLKTVPLGALGAAVCLVITFWVLSHYVLGHGATGPRALPAVLIRKPKPGPAKIPLDFRLLERTGSESAVASLLGPGRTVMYLYAPGCGHCTKMLPDFLRFAQPLEARGVAVIGVQYFGSVSGLQAAGALPGRLLADPKGEFCAKVGVGEFTVFVLDAEGGIELRSSGTDYDAISRATID